MSDDQIRSGLHAAVAREIEKIQPGAAAGYRQALDDGELCADERDSRQLGLAKAVARQCIRQVGVEKSSRAIERVREMVRERKAGRRGLSQQVNRPVAPRVLGAAPREAVDEELRARNRLDRSLAAIARAVSGDR